MVPIPLLRLRSSLYQHLTILFDIVVKTQVDQVIRQEFTDQELS